MASHGRFYIDPLSQGKRARVWVLIHQVALEEGELSYPENALPEHHAGPEGDVPFDDGGDYVNTGREPYRPVHIGHDPESAGEGARALELAIKSNTEAVVVVTDDDELPLRIADGEVEAQRSEPPADGISPAVFPLGPIDWWSSDQASAKRLWYTAGHVNGHVYVVRTGDPPDDDVYRMMGWVAAVFMQSELVGCHPSSYGFRRVD
jgi:hypothetical protein